MEKELQYTNNKLISKLNIYFDLSPSQFNDISIKLLKNSNSLEAQIQFIILNKIGEETYKSINQILLRRNKFLTRENLHFNIKLLCSKFKVRFIIQRFIYLNKFCNSFIQIILQKNISNRLNMTQNLQVEELLEFFNYEVRF